MTAPNQNASFADMDALLAANMDALEDLPPTGVPPTGFYTLNVSVERKANKEKTGEFFMFTYEVVEVGEVKNAEEADQAAVGMKFSDRFSPFKKDGSVNEWGIGFLKEACKPYQVHFGTSSVGETLANINNVVITAELNRRVDKNDPERFNFNLKNVIVL